MEKTAEEILLEQVQLLVKHRNELDEIKKELSQIKTNNIEKDLEMMNLPIPIVESKERTTRQNLVDLVNKICWIQSKQQINIWRYLYREYKIRYQIDLKDQSKKYNMSKAEYAEKFGHMENLYSLCVKLYL